MRRAAFYFLGLCALVLDLAMMGVILLIAWGVQ